METLTETVLASFHSIGAWGIFLGLLVEVIPSEIVLSLGGAMVKAGHFGWIAAGVAGVIGGTLAQLILYAIGRYGGRPFVMRYGKWLFLHPHHIEKAERWVDQYGTGMIFFARFIPIVRHAISIPCGLVQMKLSQFVLYTFAAMIPWTVLFLLIGYQLSTHWHQVEAVAKPMMLPIILFALIGMFLFFWWTKRSEKTTD